MAVEIGQKSAEEGRHGDGKPQDYFQGGVSPSGCWLIHRGPKDLNLRE